MAITASFSSRTGILSVFDDANSNTITESRDAAGNILIDGGAVVIQGDKPTVANTTLVQVFGQAGNDTLRARRIERRAAGRKSVRRRR